MYKAKFQYLLNCVRKKKLSNKMAGEQMRFHQLLKTVQCFGFANLRWECIPQLGC
jgi:hypothetical protein